MSRRRFHLAPHEVDLVEADARQLHAELAERLDLAPTFEEMPPASQALLRNMAADPYAFAGVGRPR